GIHRVMSLCVIVLFTGSIFGVQCAATDSRVTDLANKAGIRILRDSSSDKQMQRTAAAEVPLHRMSRQSQQRANHLLKHTSQYRRMPTLQYEVDASLYQYLINHPDVAIATWRVMGISKLNMWQNAPFEYSAEANDGSQGQADVLWRDGNQCLFVVEGAYHSPLLPTAIEASALVWMRYRFERTRDNRVLVNQQIETFVNFPSPAIQTIAKLASMVTNSILDRNVMEVSLYAQMMSRAVKNDSNWVEEVAARMDGIPEHRKVELTRVARGLNPYEAKANQQIARQSAKITRSTRPPIDARPETNRRSSAAAAAKTATMKFTARSTTAVNTEGAIIKSASPSRLDEALSPSKQQLLNEVRSGNVVVIVKSTKPTIEGKPQLETDSTTFLAPPKAKPAATANAQSSQVAQPETNNKTNQTATRFVSVTRSQKVIPLNNQQLSASGPTNAITDEMHPSATRPLFTGHSKDGHSMIEREDGLITGPTKQPQKSDAKEEGNPQGDASQKLTDEKHGWRPAASSRNGDQPALITLPTATVEK
ncbi:MAG: hypothetical protein ABJZ55_11060, partial [Fuerstiella sp.]